jgi:DNA-binding NarL/FixJ family response regulator
MKRVFLLSNQSLFGEGIQSLLCREAGLEIIGRESDVDRAIECIQALKPDVVVVDSADPYVDVKQVAMRILGEGSKIKVIGLNLGDNAICIYRGERRAIKEVEDLVEAIKRIRQRR